VADDIVGQWQVMKRPGDRRFSRASRTIRIGSIIPTSPDSWIARSMAQFAADWVTMAPTRPISISAMPADALLEALHNRRIDIALIDTVEGIEGYSRKRVLTTDLVAIAPASARGLRFQELLDRHTLCLTSSRTGLGQALAALSAELGSDLSATPLVEVESLPVLVRLVEQHGFISLLGRSTAESLGSRVSIAPTLPRIACAFHVVWRDSRSIGEAAKLLCTRIAAQELS
jgi:DNA-binding transcriptional LysR family regulator